MATMIHTSYDYHLKKLERVNDADFLVTFQAERLGSGTFCDIFRKNPPNRNTFYDFIAIGTTNNWYYIESGEIIEHGDYVKFLNGVVKKYKIDELLMDSKTEIITLQDQELK